MFAQISKEVLRFFTGPSRQGRNLDVHTWPVCPVLTDQEAFPTGTSTDIEPVHCGVLPAGEKVSIADDEHCELNIYLDVCFLDRSGGMGSHQSFF